MQLVTLHAHELKCVHLALGGLVVLLKVRVHLLHGLESFLITFKLDVGPFTFLLEFLFLLIIIIF